MSKVVLTWYSSCAVDEQSGSPVRRDLAFLTLRTPNQGAGSCYGQVNTRRCDSASVSIMLTWSESQNGGGNTVIKDRTSISTNRRVEGVDAQGAAALYALSKTSNKNHNHLVRLPHPQTTRPDHRRHVIRRHFRLYWTGILSTIRTL